MAAKAATSALALTSDQKQLAVQVQKYALADYALKVCGLVRPGCENAPEQQSNDFAVDKDTLTQMKGVVRTRGVKQRLQDDLGLKMGNGEDVTVKESEEDFLNRTILQLRRSEVKDVIKLFDRVEKNNRKAVANDTAFRAQRDICRKKVASDDAAEKEADIEYGTHHYGSPEEYAEFADWCEQFEYRDDEKDFSVFAGSDVIHGNKHMPDDGTFAGYDLVKIRDALYYFESNSKPQDCAARSHINIVVCTVAEKPQDCAAPDLNAEGIKTEPVKTTRPDANVIKAELAKWSPAIVVSSYRRLSLIKHPDKEGGSPESFQELSQHAKILTEACAKFHGIIFKKRATAKRKDAAKVAICTELPSHLKLALSFFGLSEDNFNGSSSVDLKKLRQAVSAEKERKDKQIQKEKELEKLLELLREFDVPEDGEAPEDAAGKNLKALKLQSMNLCKTHYGNLYGHIQKLK